MKPWTLCLITSIMIAVIFTFLTLLVIMRDKIRELFSSCFGGRQEKIEVRVDEVCEKSREIYSTPKEREPPPYVSVAETSSYVPYYEMPGYVPLKVQFERMDEEVEKRRIERERERESKARNEAYKREIKEIDERYAEKDRKIDDDIIRLSDGKYARGPDGRLCLATAINPRLRRDSCLSSDEENS